MENGYRIPDKEPPRATVDTGDPFLLLQRDLPLGMRFNGLLAEAIISPWGEKGRTFFTAAWNKVDSGLEPASQNTLTLNMNDMLRRNLKWVAEYTHDLLRDNHQLLTGIVTAF